MSANKTADKVSLIKARFEKNFREALKKDTENSLGDRSRYIGASDISGCLRSSYLSKVAKKENKTQEALNYLLEGIDRSKRIKPDELARIYYEILSLYSDLGDSKNSDEYLKKCKDLKNNIFTKILRKYEKV